MEKIKLSQEQYDRLITKYDIERASRLEKAKSEKQRNKIEAQYQAGISYYEVSK
jgi:hypothetical protein